MKYPPLIYHSQMGLTENAAWNVTDWNLQMNWKMKSIKFHYQIQSNALLTDGRGGGGGVGRSSDSVSLPDVPAPLHWGSCQLYKHFV